MTPPKRDLLTDRLRGRRRVLTGKRFEASLDRIHAHYTAIGAGKMVPHYPRSIHIPGKGVVLAKGGAPIDYSGVLRVTVEGGVTRHGHPHAIAFDAKVLGEKHNKFHHDPAQRGQLVQLIDFHRAGALAFLLIEVPKLSRVCLVYGEEVFRRLLVGDHVLVHRDETCLWPSITHEGLGYDYRRCLRALILEPEPKLVHPPTIPKLVEREVPHA